MSKSKLKNWKHYFWEFLLLSFMRLSLDISEEIVNTKLNEALRSIGILEVQKQNLAGKVQEVSKEIEATKKELEDEYGQVNIDLTDGSYSEIEKEDEE